MIDCFAYERQYGPLAPESPLHVGDLVHYKIDARAARGQIVWVIDAPVRYVILHEEHTSTDIREPHEVTNAVSPPPHVERQGPGIGPYARRA